MQTQMNLIWIGVIASFLAGLGTGVGALGVFFIRVLTERMETVLLSAAAGIMLAASFFSLLLPAIDIAKDQGFHAFAAVAIVSLGLIMGALGLYLVHQLVPHEHFLTGREGPDAPLIKRIWLFVIAIALHNFPEGMAVGVGFADGDMDNGLAIAVGIGLQNIPEGLAVAVSLLVIRYSAAQAFLVAFLTGLAEPLGGLFGSTLVTFAVPLMPWTLGLAAGAMLFIISDEVIPETHRGNHQHLATFSLLAGFVVMMFLDATLG